MNAPATRNVVCAHCLATNRVPAVRLADDPVCGRCGRALLDGAPVELTDATFDAVAGRTEVPLLVDFWAPWCGPCVGMAPEFERAARQLKGRAIAVKVNCDTSPGLAQRFAIRSIPTLVRLDGGREATRRSGAMAAAQIAGLIA